MSEKVADVTFPRHPGSETGADIVKSECFFTMLNVDSDRGESTKSLALIAGGFVFNAPVLALELGAG